MVSVDDAAGDGATDIEVTGDETGSWLEPHRVGERALSLLATPLNALVLRALAAGPLRLAELRRATGLPPQTTLRNHLAALAEIGAVTKRPGSELPFAIENRLTAMGRDMLDLARLLEDWLGDAPAGAMPLTDGSAKGVIKALVDGWGSTILQTMALHPMSLTELDRHIEAFSYPAIERRLASLRMAGLIEALPNIGASTPYTLSEWGRRGVAPLVAAGRCEARHLRAEAPMVTRKDVEAAFLMAVPLIGLPSEASGACRLEVESDGDDRVEGTVVTVTVAAGRVVSCDLDPDVAPVAYAAGSAENWFAAIGEGSPDGLRLEGGSELAEWIVSGLHTALVRG